MFVHTVYFWLKEGTPAAARDQLVSDCREYLGKIPTVRQLMAGVPAMTPRDVVDNSYGVGLTVVLARLNSATPRRLMMAPAKMNAQATVC